MGGDDDKLVRQSDLKAILNAMAMRDVRILNLQIENLTIRAVENVMLLSNRLAVEFINDQFFARLAQANFVTGALLLASNEYNGILGVKDARKGLDIELLSLILIVAPGIGPIAKGLASWADPKESTAIKRFIAHLGNNVNDLHGAVSVTDNPADNTSLKKANSVNQVIRKALAEAYKQVGRAMLIHSAAGKHVIDKGLTEFQIQNLWKNSGLLILDTSMIGMKWTLFSNNTLELLAKTFLYDMLRAYTKKYCKVVIGATSSMDTMRRVNSSGVEFDAVNKGVKLEENLPQDLSTVGEFQGMSQGSRYEIYKRFGDGLDSSRPPIRGYRDMIKANWVDIVKSSS